MRNINIFYHYYPAFRKNIFDGMKKQNDIKYCFIYGKNGRNNVKVISEKNDLIFHNFFVGNLIFQSLNLRVLNLVTKNDSVILGDIYFMNSWLYILLSKLFRKKCFLWTHGILKEDTGLKKIIRNFYYNLSDGLLTYHDEANDLLRNQGIKCRINTIGNSNFSQSQLNQFSNIELEYTDQKFCYVGRISQSKEFSKFIDFVKKYPEKKLLLMGPCDFDINKYTKKYPNLLYAKQEYDLRIISEITRKYPNFIIFSSCGLAIYTAAILKKRIFALVGKQKPEYYLLKKHYPIYEFDSLRYFSRELPEHIFSYANLEKCTSETVVENLRNGIS